MTFLKSIWILSVGALMIGCSLRNGKYDGIYDAHPFDIGASGGDLYLVIDKGKVYLSDEAGEWYQAGYIQGNSWIAWNGCEILFTKGTNSIVMQLIGQESYLEFPAIEMGSKESFLLNKVRAKPFDDFVSTWPDPPQHGRGIDARWKTIRKWTDVYGYDAKIETDRCFVTDISLSNIVLVCTLTYVGNEELGFVLYPKSFKGIITVISQYGVGETITINPSSEPVLTMMLPGESIRYEVDLARFTKLPQLSERLSDGILFSQFEVDMPKLSVRSNVIRNHRTRDEKND